MNLAMAEAVRRQQDILLLNSDTIVHPGALPEMIRVAALDAMTGFVNPRSDNATLATLPIARRGEREDSSFDIAPYAALAERLPAFSYVPTAVGFCMLIRWQVLAEFGGFDEVFGAGYNEENDLVMRAGRCGYRAVLANRAFVRHAGEQSFGTAAQTKSELDRINRAILDERYPEYAALTAAYFTSPEAVAETLLGTLIADAAGRLDFAFDFSSFAARHTGTYKAGRQLLISACRDWRERFNLFVLCTQEVYDFHAYAELGIARREPDGAEIFAAVFRMGQVYDWPALRRLVRKAAVIGINMLDTISIDCTQLTSAALHDIWQFSLSHGDFFVAPSAQSLRQIGLRFVIPDRVGRAAALLSLDLNDYLPEELRPPPKPAEGAAVLLVVGNHFPHKFLVPTANALAAAFPDRKIVALGQPKPGIAEPFNPYGLPLLETSVNLAGIDVGHLSDEALTACYIDADAVVFPSHYEGFGFPVLDALALRRPVFLRRLPVFEELYEGLGRNPNMHFYATTAELVARLQTLPPWQETPDPPPAELGAARSASQVLALVEAALLRADYHVIAGRIRAVPAAPEPAPPPPPAPPPEAPVPAIVPTQLDLVAGFAATRFEWLVRRAFAIRPVYFASRTGFRALRPIVRLLRAAGRVIRG